MTMTFDEALAHLRNPRDLSESEYRTACEIVADNRESLTYRVFIHLPGGLSGNHDPAWERVKAASEECCSCGNERVFEPLDMRHEFEPSSAEPVTLAQGDKLYIRPIGAPASTAYAMLEIIDANGPALSYLSDPMSAINFADLFSTKGYRLDDLARMVRDQSAPPVFMRSLRQIQNIPLLAISAVDSVAGTVTLILDAAVEAFDPDNDDAHAH